MALQWSYADQDISYNWKDLLDNNDNKGTIWSQETDEKNT